MSADQAPNSDPERRLDEITATYLQAREAGNEPDPQAILAAHPELARELGAFFEANAQLRLLLDSSMPGAPLSGTRFGRFRLIRKLGGGMGQVFEAEDMETGDRIALKAMLTFALPDATDRERFLRATEALARLDHPNLVPILEHGECLGVPYFTMPLIDGSNLRTVIREMRSGVRELVPANKDSQWGAIATIGLQIAQALEHAHAHEVLHRDIKPSNILLDADGRALLIDFGLARARGQADLTESGELAGTLRYMPPERLTQRWTADPRSDLYSLGLTLYELLTLRPAFNHADTSRLIRAISDETPAHPRRLRREIPKPLDLIVRKAIAKEPGHRYQATTDLKNDLTRYLEGHPPLAKLANPAHLVLSWARSHKRQTTTLATIPIGVLAIGLAGLAYEHSRRDLAEARAGVAERSMVLYNLQRDRIGPHSAGWYEALAWPKVRALAKSSGSEPALQREALGCLYGLDARSVRVFDGIGCSSTAFSPAGQLLMGGVTDAKDSAVELNSRVWNGSSATLTRHFDIRGAGPVGFRDEDTPIQLVVDQAKNTLTLFDLCKAEAIHCFDIPGLLDLRSGEDTPLPVAITPDGSLVGAAVILPGNTRGWVVWSGETGERLQVIPGQTSAAAFAPDGSLVALGDDSGVVRVWNLAATREEARLSMLRNRINVVAFGRNPRRSHDGLDPLTPRRRWQLVAGDAGSMFMAWDLGYPLAQVRASNWTGTYEVYCLAISPDGSTLATGGREATAIWDLATGRLLLRFGPSYYQYGLAFSPDGSSVATGSQRSERNIDGAKWNRVQVVELASDRGVAGLRGLSSHPQHIIFSPDDSLVAAISQDWRIAVWDLPTRRLLVVIDAPQGETVDNAALAISHDNRRIAFSSFDSACVWEIDSGRLVHRWPLPQGMIDRMAYRLNDDLILARAQPPATTAGQVGIATDWKRCPSEYAVYNLTGRSSARPIHTIPSFPGGIRDAGLDSNGETLIVTGVQAESVEARTGLRAFDVATGDILWSLDPPIQSGSNIMPVLSPDGKLAMVKYYDPSGRPMWLLVDARKGRTIDWLEAAPIGVRAEFFVNSAYAGLYRRGRENPILQLLDPNGPFVDAVTFGRDAQHVHLAGRGPDRSTVVVADLDEILRRLASVNLGW